MASHRGTSPSDVVRARQIRMNAPNCPFSRRISRSTIDLFSSCSKRCRTGSGNLPGDQAGIRELTARGSREMHLSQSDSRYRNGVEPDEPRDGHTRTSTGSRPASQQAGSFFFRPSAPYPGTRSALGAAGESHLEATGLRSHGGHSRATDSFCGGRWVAQTVLCGLRSVVAGLRHPAVRG